MKIKIISLLVLVFALIGCNGEDEVVVETSTEMVGEPVNIRLSGQFEMCEREPESVLCETYEVEVEEVVEVVEAEVVEVVEEDSTILYGILEEDKDNE